MSWRGRGGAGSFVTPGRPHHFELLLTDSGDMMADYTPKTFPTEIKIKKNTGMIDFH